jgi:hypothetical protein
MYRRNPGSSNFLHICDDEALNIDKMNGSEKHNLVRTSVETLCNLLHAALIIE